MTLCFIPKPPLIDGGLIKIKYFFSPFAVTYPAQEEGWNLQNLISYFHAHPPVLLY
jgi:hypothetical protein